MSYVLAAYGSFFLLLGGYIASLVKKSRELDGNGPAPQDGEPS